MIRTNLCPQQSATDCCFPVSLCVLIFLFFDAFCAISLPNDSVFLWACPWLIFSYNTLAHPPPFGLLRLSLRAQRPYMQVRGKATVDGFFSVPKAQFGAPDIPTADEVVRITVFPTTSIQMQSEKPGDLISPDLLDRYCCCLCY